jgi:hypothetical protein
MSIRESFVEHFGEADAYAVECAAAEHMNPYNSERKGDDHFLWAIVICIGSECMSRYSDYHGIKAPWEEVRAWIKNHANIGEHIGDIDYLAMFVGLYQEFIPNLPNNPS